MCEPLELVTRRFVPSVNDLRLVCEAFQILILGDGELRFVEQQVAVLVECRVFHRVDLPPAVVVQVVIVYPFSSPQVTASAVILSFGLIAVRC